MKVTNDYSYCSVLGMIWQCSLIQLPYDAWMEVFMYRLWTVLFLPWHDHECTMTWLQSGRMGNMYRIVDSGKTIHILVCGSRYPEQCSLKRKLLYTYIFVLRLFLWQLLFIVNMLQFLCTAYCIAMIFDYYQPLPWCTPSPPPKDNTYLYCHK